MPWMLAGKPSVVLRIPLEIPLPPELFLGPEGTSIQVRVYFDRYGYVFTLTKTRPAWPSPCRVVFGLGLCSSGVRMSIFTRVE